MANGWVETLDELDARVPVYRREPGAPDKQLDFLDRHARAFIATTPLVLLATADRDGRLDVTPRGDPAGFVQVLGERTLLMPERKGNRRFDALRNVLANPRVGLLFVVPGRADTLRVNGRARITDDPARLAPCAVRGVVPPLGLVVEVEELFFHCARSFLRGSVWEPQNWPDSSGLASLGTALADQMALSVPGTVLDAELAHVNCDLY